MSQFRKYVIAEIKLKELVGYAEPRIHREFPTYYKEDINWEYFEVVEIAALEAAKNEIEQFKTHKEYEADGFKTMFEELKRENAKLSAALKVAVDALAFYTGGDHSDIELDVFNHFYRDHKGNLTFDDEWLCKKARQALAEIQKIKEELK